MPYLNITTNQSVTDENALLKAASKTVASASGKPESYVMIRLNHNVAMSFAGSTDPAAILDYRSLGLPADRKAFSDALCTLIEQQIGVSGSRTYISMTDSERQNWGWDHSTF
ncbi:putative ATLS1-like light-inducible protein [Methylophaga frappieri]|uniref:L-dopachrome isomerase n=1 Tax=Methylophaga frappieri (strain ATCC BAA-2434 / DSM 25690 / JAM7) TaxID=754477 RepID=I1YKZ5_METFJ|nr:phenylpyruvate tautomerase MIF-related protein [Methylophaga frappieri]AFJ03588.1 putative ATLS1-like light-inducible protein [Methylophaga frappieri]